MVRCHRCIWCRYVTRTVIVNVFRAGHLNNFDGEALCPTNILKIVECECISLTDTAGGCQLEPFRNGIHDDVAICHGCRQRWIVVIEWVLQYEIVRILHNNPVVG